MAEDLSTELVPAHAGGRPATGGGGAEGAPRGPVIGRTLGKFLVRERLGQGGVGEVLLAEQVELGRSAVIKVLRRDVTAGAHRVERFLREARLASRLDHPYAAHVYAFGAEPDGLLWIAMEHVRGVTLDELIGQRGPIPPAVFGPLFERLCEVVHTAHELGIVHRDIKGGNVMVIERAGQLLPKLLDFGIAKGAEDRARPAPHPTPDPDRSDRFEAPQLTADGATLGSPHFMAPEQWDAPGDVDARADIYALGVLAYRCVSARLPFQGVPRLELPEAHARRAPAPLPRAVEPALAEVILRALAKRPDERWPSALALGEAVRRACGGAAPEAVPLLDPAVRDTWTRHGPQPIADAVARLAGAATTVEADAALREVVAITCRWLAVLALAHLGDDAVAPALRESARAVVGRDDAGPWLALARALAAALPADDDRAPTRPTMRPALRAALAGADDLADLAARLDGGGRARTAAGLAADVPALADALRPLAPLTAFALVVGRPGGAESWQGVRRRDRERVVVWGPPLADGEVALLDPTGARVVQLAPLVQILAPLPSGEPELFLLWRSARGQARLVAAPWGYERDDEAAAARLAVLTTEDEATLAEAQGEASPYPGLAAYGVDDADRFVGREREVEALANRLVRAPLLAVLGPSGAGKSSFLHAGVMPRLAEHHALRSLRPGRHPMHALAALPGIDGDTQDGAGLAARLRALGERAPRGLVLVIDQLEELVTLCADPAERAAFAAVLAAAADGPAAPVRVVVTLRDDFASVLESEAALRGRFEVFVLATPPPEALRRIVTEPARRAGVTLEPRVVDDMVAEVAGRPASLPLLSFTASLLWQARDREARRITHASYAALGGVAGALATYADQLHDSLARKDQDVARDLFARLVAADGTRIPAPRRELEGLPGARAVLGHLIDARLLVVREDEGTDVVEIVHECLATRWPRLARWRSEDAADRALLADVGAATRRWLEAGRRPDLLWRGQALGELRRLGARSTALTADERAFLDAATAAEARARRRRRGLVIAAMATLAVVAVIMASLGLAADRSRRAAEASATSAREAAALAEDRLTASLIAQGRRELNDNRALAALAYFGEALRRGADTPGLRFVLALALRGLRDEVLVVRDGVSSIEALIEPAGGFALGAGGEVRLYDARAAEIARVKVDVGTVFGLRAVDDALVAWGARGVARIDMPGGVVRVTAETDVQVIGAAVGPAPDELTVLVADAALVYGPDGAVRRRRALDLDQATVQWAWGRGQLVIERDGALEALDLRTLATRPLARGVFAGPAASADGATIVYLDEARRVHVLDGAAREVTAFAPRGRAEGVYVSATGDRIAVAGERLLALHDRSGGERRVLPLSPQDEELRLRVAGDDVWTGSTHGVLRRYEAGRLVSSHPAHLSEVADLRVAGPHVLSLGQDRALVVTRADARQLAVTPGPCAAGAMMVTSIGVGFACPDGRMRVYVGRRPLGVIDEDDLHDVAVDPVTGASAIAGASALRLLAADGSVRRELPAGDLNGLAFDGRGALVAVRQVERRAALVRLDESTGAWIEEVAPLPGGAAAIAVVAAGTLLGGVDAVLVYRDGREVARVPTGAPVAAFATSRDGRWVSAHLDDGATVILDARTGLLDRRLEPVDALGVAAVLDPRGDLVVRTGRGTLTIWERATGDPLVWNLEFLRGAYSAAFDEDGRLEVVGDDLVRVDVPAERRSPAEILADIDCRVPLRVVGTRLEPAAPRCSGRSSSARPPTGSS